MSDYNDRLDADIERADRRIRETGEQVAAHVRRHGPVTGRATAPNGSITVVAGPGGRLVELRIEHAALNLRPEQLAAELVRLAGHATREANARAHRSIGTVVGPAVTESLSELGIKPGSEEDTGGLDFLGEAAAMTEPPVDELVARAEMRRQASERLPQLVASTTGVAMDERRLVQATTTASGELRDLQLHPAALSFGGRELAKMVLQAAELATEYAKQRCFNALALVLGDIATAELEAMIGPAPARAAGWDTAPTRGPEPVQEAETPAIGVPSLEDVDPEDPLSFDPSSLRSDR